MRLLLVSMRNVTIQRFAPPQPAMKRSRLIKLSAALTLAATATCPMAPVARASSGVRIETVNGLVEGTTTGSGIRVFRGIPFAAPPVGDLRWKAPQPVKNWTGVRQAVDFGPNCMQRPIYGDMEFRNKGM